VTAPPASPRASLRPVLPLALAAFFLMLSYGMLRPLANSLYSQLLGAPNLFWAMGLGPLLVVLLLWPYGYGQTRLGPRLTLAVSTGLSALVLLAATALRSPEASFLLYIWKEAYIVLLLEQFWAFSNSSFSLGSGKRFYGLLLLSGGLGDLGGNLLVTALAQPLGSWNLATLAVLALGPFFYLMNRAHWTHEAASPDPLTSCAARTSDDPLASCAARTSDDPLASCAAGTSDGPLASCAAGNPASGSTSRSPRPLSGHTGWRLLFSSPRLGLLALIIAAGQVVSATMDVSFHVHLQELLPDLDRRSAHEAAFWASVNGASMGLNLLAPLLLPLLSVRRLQLLIPLTHLVTLAAALLYPGVWTSALALGWFKAADYSLFRSSKELLYIPLDFDARYRTKLLIDMGVYRVSKGAAALLLALAGAARNATLLPAVALAATLAWLACVPKMTKP
jgi:ATP/ADP translocase